MDKNELLRARMLRANEIQKSKYGCGIGAALRVRMGDRRRAYAQATIECNLGEAMEIVGDSWAYYDDTDRKEDAQAAIDLLKEARSYIDQMATGKAAACK